MSYYHLQSHRPYQCASCGHRALALGSVGSAPSPPLKPDGLNAAKILTMFAHNDTDLDRLILRLEPLDRRKYFSIGLVLQG